jgi:hypothetical protein
VSVPYFLLFLCFRKATQEIFSELDETSSRSLIFPERGPKTEREPEGARPPVVRPPWSPPDDAPSPISSLPMENPKRIGKFPERVPPPPPTNFGGHKSLFRHPAKTGKCPRSHLHRSPSPSPPSPSTSPPSPPTLLSPMMRRE